MTDQTITVQPGTITGLPVQLQTGTTIQNQSPTNAVWFSSQANVTIGRGTKISPYGTLQWNGGPCYAYGEGTTPSTLSLSTTSAQPTNPYDVARAINAQGVPNVLTGGSITGVINNSPFDVSQYATVSFVLSVPTPGYCAVTFWDSYGGNQEIWGRNFTFGGARSWWFASIPVLGPWMNIMTNGNTPATIKYVFGTNRDSNGVLSTTDGNFYGPNGLTTTGAGKYYVGNPFATLGGVSSWYMRADSTFAGAFGYDFWDVQGTAVPGAVQEMQIAHTKQLVTDDSGTNVAGTFNDVYLPAGVLRPWIYANAAGTFSAVRYRGMVS